VPQSPYSDRVYVEWERLVFPTTPLSLLEKEARWAALYKSCVLEGAWSVAINDASLVASLGITLALQSGRFEEAVGLADFYLQHSDAGSEFDCSWDEIRTRLGVSMILSGRMEEGLATLDAVLSSGHHKLELRTYILRDDLLALLQELGPEEVADGQIKAFVSRLLMKWPGQGAGGQRALGAGTYGELSGLLEATFSSSQSDEQ